jgi:hypothetical protein
LDDSIGQRLVVIFIRRLQLNLNGLSDPDSQREKGIQQRGRNSKKERRKGVTREERRERGQKRGEREKRAKRKG